MIFWFGVHEKCRIDLIFDCLCNVSVTTQLSHRCLFYFKDAISNMKICVISTLKTFSEESRWFC